MNYVIGIAVVVVVIAAVVGVLKNKKRAQLKQQYEEALRGTDKALALSLGRAYYASFNKGNVVTVADEARIANELSTMKV